MTTRRALLLGAGAFVATRALGQDDPIPWERLRAGGLVLLMRHAATEAGTGDPPDMRLGECGTQRNLSAEGRTQARRVGERLRAARVPIAKVFTSPWCRCRETAQLAFGEAEDWTMLGSFFDAPDREAEATERVKKRIAGYATRKPKGNVVMVTHNVNVAALTKLSIGPAEIVIARPDGCCGVRPVQHIRLA